MDIENTTLEKAQFFSGDSPTNFRRDNDPLGDDLQYRPLQFSFLGQIYAKKSLKKQYRRHSSSLRWPRQTGPMTITTNPNPIVPEIELNDQVSDALSAIQFPDYYSRKIKE